MDFSSLYNTEDKFYIEFSSPVDELGISDTITFPNVENWNVSEVEYVKRVTPTYYIIECNDCVIRLEDDTDRVYVLVHNMHQTEELRKIIMHKDEPVTNVDDKYATGIKHVF